MLTREQKKQVVESLTQALKKAKGAVFTTFQELRTSDLQKLRSELKKEGIRHTVVKLTLLKRALDSAGIEAQDFSVQLPLAVSLSEDDEVAPARILEAFARTHGKLQIVAGILDRRLIEAKAVKQLAVLPSKPELRGQVVSAIASPLRGFVNVLAGNLRGLMNVLGAIRDQRT